MGSCPYNSVPIFWASVTNLQGKVMTDHLQQAHELLFGADGVRASNIKFFPGASREASAEMIAAEVVSSLNQIHSGKAEEYQL